MRIRLRTWQPAVLLAGLAVLAGAANATGATGAAVPAYLNTSLPPEVRAADLVHRMTLREKASQLVNGARAIPRLGVPAYNWWSEALHGVAVDGTTEFPEPIGLGATFDVAGRSRDGPRHRHRGPGRARAGSARRRLDDLSRPRLLGAQHQHLPRSPLGPRTGDLRRGPVPHRPHGRRLRHGHAGLRSTLLPRDLHAEALRRAQRARSPRVTSPTSTSASTTWRTPTCRRSAPPSSTATPAR